MKNLLSATISLSRKLFLFQLVTIYPVIVTAGERQPAIERINLFLEQGQKACMQKSRHDEKLANEISEVQAALHIRYCQKGDREIAISPESTPNWLQVYFHKLNSEIAKDNGKQFKHVFHTLKVVDAFKTQKEKENYLIELRSHFDKHKQPKIFQSIQNKLYTVSPRYLPPELKNYIRIGRDYKNNGDFKKALKFLRRGWQKLKLSAEENHKLSIEITQAVKATRGYSQYIPQTEKYIKYFRRNNKNNIYSNAIFEHSVNLIRANWTKGRTKRAKLVAENLVKEFPNKETPYLLWLLASINRDLNKKKTSRKYLFQALEKLRNTESQHFEKIIFDIATTSYQDLDAKLYEEILKQDLERIKFDRDKQRLYYWQARLLDETKKDKQAREVYQKILEINPISYYALLSSSRTGILPKVTIKEISTHNIPTNLWFLQLENPTLRDWYLKHIEYSDESMEEGLLIAKLMQKEGLYHESFKFLYEFPQEQLIIALKKYPKLFYPYAFSEFLQNTPVDPLLALAIIKRESLYNPNAQSIANALGLMQVLPAVGKQMNRKIKQNSQLFDPKVNIHVGTKYIARVLKRFDQNLVQSIAAYNAGPRRVKIWKKKNIFKGDLDESIEKIPYMETRKYVKKVVRNYLNYKRLYDEDFSLEDLKVLVKENES